MAEIDNLRERAETIAGATAKGENTAMRVGSLFADIVEEIAETEAGLNELAEASNDLLVKTNGLDSRLENAELQIQQGAEDARIKSVAVVAGDADTLMLGIVHGSGSKSAPIPMATEEKAGAMCAHKVQQLNSLQASVEDLQGRTDALETDTIADFDGFTPEGTQVLDQGTPRECLVLYSRVQNRFVGQPKPLEGGTGLGGAIMPGTEACYGVFPGCERYNNDTATKARAGVFFRDPQGVLYVYDPTRDWLCDHNYYSEAAHSEKTVPKIEQTERAIRADFDAQTNEMEERYTGRMDSIEDDLMQTRREVETWMETFQGEKGDKGDKGEPGSPVPVVVCTALPATPDPNTLYLIQA